MSDWGPAYPRISRWLGSGLRELGVAADLVDLNGPEGVELKGSTREVRLGVRRARSAFGPLRRYFAEAEPEVVLAIPQTIAMVASIVGRTAGCPVIPWFVTIPRLDARDTPLRLRPLRAAAPLLLGGSPRVAAVSADVRGALLDEFRGHIDPDRIVVLPTPLDADEVRRLANPPTTKANSLRICSVGRLSHAKGFDVLIDALSRAHLTGGWEAVIVGAGPLRDQLVRQVHNAGLEGHVTFSGYLERHYPLMASADIAVQPSRWEGFSLAMGEFLALGVALVTTDCVGGFRDVMGDAGIIVPVGDPQALADAIVLLANDPEMRRAAASRGPERIAGYSPELVAGQIMQLVAEVAGPRETDPLGDHFP